MKLPDDSGVIGSVVKSSQTMVIKKVGLGQDIINPADEKIEYDNILCVPIITNGKVKGVLGVVDQKDTEMIGKEDLFFSRIWRRR